MKSAQQGTFSCQNAVFLVNWLVLYQGRGLAAFHTGRDICSQECLHLYLARWKWQYLPLCSASSTSVSRGQEALSAITQRTQKFSSKLPYSLSGTVCGCSLFFCFCTQHILFEWFWGFALFVCARMCVNVCWSFMLQDPRRGTVSVLWVCKTLGTLGTQWSSLAPLVQQAIILNL